jgi:hypothetical protein
MVFEPVRLGLYEERKYIFVILGEYCRYHLWFEIEQPFYNDL